MTDPISSVGWCVALGSWGRAKGKRGQEVNSGVISGGGRGTERAEGITQILGKGREAA